MVAGKFARTLHPVVEKLFALGLVIVTIRRHIWAVNEYCAPRPGTRADRSYQQQQCRKPAHEQN